MYSKKKTALIVLITFLLTSVLYTAAYTIVPSFSSMLGDVRAYLGNGANAEFNAKMNEINSIIDNFFIYDYDKKEMSDVALAGYVAGLNDVYSEYIPKKEYREMMEQLTGDYKGIGVEVYLGEDGGIVISAVFENGPAEKAGMLEGDIITAVNGTRVSAENYNQAIDMMKGSNDQKDSSDELTLTIMRNGSESQLEVTRAEVINQTVRTKLLDGKIGYIRISQFDEATGDDFGVRAEQLINDGAKSFIIDLRNNPGGTLTGVVSVADKLLPKGKIITIKDKQGEEIVYNSDKNEIKLPMCVLINGSSASAAEVLAGALRDHKKATLVGEKSYGKGVVQSIFDLSDKSALKLTTSEYFTPSGESIHKKGITPDYVVELPEGVNYLSLKEADDIQLKKAIEILSK